MSVCTASSGTSHPHAESAAVEKAFVKFGKCGRKAKFAKNFEKLHVRHTIKGRRKIQQGSQRAVMWFWVVKPSVDVAHDSCKDICRAAVAAELQWRENGVALKVSQTLVLPFFRLQNTCFCSKNGQNRRFNL